MGPPENTPVRIYTLRDTETNEMKFYLTDGNHNVLNPLHQHLRIAGDGIPEGRQIPVGTTVNFDIISDETGYVNVHGPYVVEESAIVPPEALAAYAALEQGYQVQRFAIKRRKQPEIDDLQTRVDKAIRERDAEIKKHEPPNFLAYAIEHAVEAKKP